MRLESVSGLKALLPLLVMLLTAAPTRGAETPLNGLFADCFAARQNCVDVYMLSIRELVGEYGQGQQLDLAAKLQQHIGGYAMGKRPPAIKESLSPKHKPLIEHLHQGLNHANDQLRKAATELAANESKAGNVNRALAIRQQLNKYLKGEKPLNAAMFPERYAVRVVKVGHPYPRLAALSDRTLPSELKHEHFERSTRIFGGGQVDTVKVGKLTVGHIGKAVIYGNARGRKGWIRIGQPAKSDATGYFAILSAKTTSFSTVRLSGLQVGRRYEWSIDYADGAYHFVVSDNGQPIVEKKIRTIRKLDIGFAATVRRRGNLADLKVWTDFAPPSSLP